MPIPKPRRVVLRSAYDPLALLRQSVVQVESCGVMNKSTMRKAKRELPELYERLGKAELAVLRLKMKITVKEVSVELPSGTKGHEVESDERVKEVRAAYREKYMEVFGEEPN